MQIALLCCSARSPKAIASLKPEGQTGDQLPLVHAYEVLHYRYVQQCSQQEVADQLGVTVRHLKREQQRALETLAVRLGERYGIHITWDQKARNPMLTTVVMKRCLDDDLHWLEDAQPAKPCLLSEVVPAVTTLVDSLAAQHEVSISVSGMDGLPEEQRTASPSVRCCSAY